MTDKQKLLHAASLLEGCVEQLRAAVAWMRENDIDDLAHDTTGWISMETDEHARDAERLRSIATFNYPIEREAGE